MKKFTLLAVAFLLFTQMMSFAKQEAAKPAAARRTPEWTTTPLFVENSKKPTGFLGIQRGPSTPVVAVAFSPDGKYLASSGYKEVLLWNLKEAKLEKRLATGITNDLLFINPTTLVAGTDAAAALWDVTTGKEKQKFDVPSGALTIALRPDKKLFAAGANDGKLYLFPLTSDAPKIPPRLSHRDAVSGLAFTPDGKQLLSVGRDRAIVLWGPPRPAVTSKGKKPSGKQENAKEEKPAPKKPGDAYSLLVRQTLKYPAISLTVPSESSFVCAAGDTTGWAVYYATFASLTAQSRRSSFNGSMIYLTGSRPTAMVSSPKDARVFFTQIDGQLQSFDPLRRRRLDTIKKYNDWYYDVDATPDGRLIAVGCADGSVKLFQFKKAKPTDQSYYPGVLTLLANFCQIFVGEDQHIIATEQGPFTGNALQYVKARKGADVTNVSPDNAFRDELNNAEKVRQIINDNKK